MDIASDLNVTSSLPRHPSAMKCYQYLSEETIDMEGASFPSLAQRCMWCDRYPKNTGKQYFTQIAKIYDYMCDNGYVLGYGEFWHLINTKNSFDDLLAFVMKMTIANGTRDASMATKRAFLDGWLFLLSLVAHIDSTHDYSSYYDRVSTLYNGIDYQIQEQVVDMRAEVLTRDQLLNMIEAHFRTGSEQRAILGIYTCLPLRDDLQLKSETCYSMGSTCKHHCKTSTLITKGKHIYIYVARSKTIKEGHLYHLDNARAVQFVFEYLATAPGDYPFGQDKNSWRILNWTAQMGIYLVFKGPKGKRITRRAGIDYFRRVNKAAEIESDDPLQIGRNLADSAHTAMTALKYRGTII